MDTRPPVESDEEVDQQKLKATRDLLLQLVKTAKTIRLYLANNPIHQKFLAELFERFDLYLRTYGSLRLKVRQSAFLVDGQVVYENDNRQESLALRCYIDGIGELVFHEGLEQRELVEFLDIVGSERDAAVLDEDLVSLIWKRDFPHLTYVVVEDHLDGTVLPGLTQSKGVNEANLQELVKQEVMEAQSVEMAGPKRLEFPLAVFKLTEEEIAQLKEQIIKEQQRDAVAQLLDILTVMLEIEQDEVSFVEVLGLLEKLVDLFIDRGDLAHAALCVQAVRRLWDAPPPLLVNLRPQLHEFLLRLGTQDRLHALMVMLNSQGSVDTEALFQYVVSLTPPSIIPLTDLLGSVNSLKARKTVCEALVELARHDVELLASRLRDDRWFVVRNLIYVLGRIGGPQVVDHLARLVRHPEQRVRKEVVKTFDGMEHPKVVSVLIQFLQDQESAVRLMALRALTRRKSPEAVAPLAAIIAGRNFAAKDLSEKFEIFVALAMSGQPGALTLLKHYLRSVSWWKRGGHEQLRWCAAYALKQMGTPEAIALLEEGSHGRDRRLQEACLAALRGTERELMMKQGR